MQEINCTSIIRLHLMYNKKKATAYLFCDNGEIKKHSFKRGSDDFFTKSSFIYEACTQHSPAECFKKLEEGFYFYDAQHIWAKEKATHHPHYKGLMAYHHINAVSHLR